MTRKDYIIIARAIKDYRRHIANQNTDVSQLFAGMAVFITILAKELKKDNPLFKADKFIKAIIN